MPKSFVTMFDLRDHATGELLGCKIERNAGITSDGTFQHLYIHDDSAPCIYSTPASVPLFQQRKKS